MTGAWAKDERCGLPTSLQSGGQCLGKDRRGPKGIVTTNNKDDFGTTKFDRNAGPGHLPWKSAQAFLEQFEIANWGHAVDGKQGFCWMRNKREGRSTTGKARAQRPFEAVLPRTNVRPYDRRRTDRDHDIDPKII